MHFEHKSDQAQNPSVSSDSSPLRLVFWETTIGCNLECVHCRRMEESQELSKHDLSTEQARELIDQIATVGRPVLVFSGGEPLMRPDIFELAVYAKKVGLITALATNATLINLQIAGKIAEAAFERVSISFDGADPATHDAFRGQAGSFERAIEGARLLRNEGVSIQVNCTIARHNMDQIEDILKLAESIGAVAVHYFLLVPVGCGVQIAESQMLNKNQIEERLKLIYQLDRQTSLQIKPTCAPHYYRILRQEAKGLDQPQPSTSSESSGSLYSVTKGCLAGSAVCFVSHTGEVYPCGYLPISAGDVKLHDFADIWRNSSVFADLRDPKQLTGKCAQCEFIKVCGGCRARAFYQSGDYLAEEPYCAYQPKSSAKKGNVNPQQNDR
ncbi:MAG: radical SAM protein [Planctomycetota bacterium]|nr:MAG: radical SAM protein [Planctomycetota bacterium]